MATYTINQNVDTAITDFGMIKQAIVNKGVSVPTGTPTSQYAAKIASIPSGGGSDEDFQTLIDRSLAGTVTIPDNTTDIGMYAFAYCEELEDVVIPNTVTNIHAYAFGGCESLELTSLPNSITEIGDNAFEGCTSLALTSLPNGLTVINEGTFWQCRNLALTSLPSGITYIGSGAFNQCRGLTTLTFLGTPSFIASDAFSNCTNLTTINVPWSNGDVSGAPWGATNATITYDYVPTP